MASLCKTVNLSRDFHKLLSQDSLRSVSAWKVVE